MLCDATEVLDFVDEPLDQVAVLIDVFVVGDGLRSRAARWDHGLRAGCCDSGAEAIGVKALIGEQVLESKAADQVFGLEDAIWSGTRAFLRRCRSSAHSSGRYKRCAIGR